jgi:hypothetical protein
MAVIARMNPAAVLVGDPVLLRPVLYGPQLVDDLVFPRAMLLGAVVRRLVRRAVQEPVPVGLRCSMAVLVPVLVVRCARTEVPGGVLPALRGVVLVGVVRAVRLGAGTPAQVVPRSGGVAGRVRPACQLGPDQQSGAVFLRAPGQAQRVDEKQSPPVLLLWALRGGVGFARGAALVPYGYAHGVVLVVQLAHHTAARGVHDRVRDQLGYDQGRTVAGVRAHRPAGQPGVREASGLGDGARMGGKLEAEPALGSAPVGGCPLPRSRTGSRGDTAIGAKTGPVCGGVCS